MKRTLLTLLAATALAAALPAVASAQAWNVNERQAQLDQRIDVGVRNGQLNQREAEQLRVEFRAIARLERDYRANGLSERERMDLDARFDQLSQRIRMERSDSQDRRGQDDRRDDRYDDRRGGQPDRRADRYDNQDRREQGRRRADRWENLNQRQAQFRQRLNRAVADRRITQRQAQNLQAQFTSIAQIERDYRRNGLTQRERADLDRRFDQLQANFRASVQASQYGYGYGQAPNLFDYLFGIR
jgi:hypothetical protein